MNRNYSQKQVYKLHSPLLEGGNHSTEPLLPNENREAKNESADETLDKLIYTRSTKKENKKSLSSNISINETMIETLETLLKVGGILIVAVGGIFCTLELSNIVKLVQAKNYNFANELMLFSLVFIFTLTANAICLGFSHLVKMSKYIFLTSEAQNAKMDKIIATFSGLR